MGKLLKYLGFFVLFLIVSVVAAIVVIPMVVDPNDFKDRIVAETKQATGRDLTIAGDIGLSVFPWVGLVLGETRLGESPAFGGGDFAAVESVEIRAKLLPLLQQRLEMDTLRLRGLDVRLVRNEAGVGDWEDLAGGGSASPEEKEKEDDLRSPPKALALSVGGVELSNAHIRFEDRQAGQAIRLDQISLVTGAVVSGQPVDLDLGFDVDLAEPKLAGRFRFTAQARMDEAFKSLRLNGSELHFDGSADGFGIRSSQLRFSSDIGFDRETQRLDLDALELTLQAAAGEDAASAWKAVDMKLQGSLRLPGQGQGTVTMEGLNLDLDVQGPEGGFKAAKVALKTGEMSFDPDSGRLAAPGLSLRSEVMDNALPEGAFHGELRTAFGADLKAMNVRLDDLSLSAPGVALQGEVLASAIGAEEQRFSGQIDLAPFDLRRLLERLGQKPPVTADPKALTQVAFRTGFEFQGNSVRLRDLRGGLDGSELLGEVSVDDFAGPVAHFNLTLDRLDADRYLPPKPPQQEEGAPTEDKDEDAAQPPIALPLDMLRALQVNGSLRVGEFKINRLKTQDMELKLKARDGVVALDPFEAKLYGGRVQAYPRLDVRKDVPVMAVKSRLAGFRIEPFLSDLQGEPGKLSGTTDLDADLLTSGLTPKAMKAGLNGTVKFKLANGAVKGFNLAHAVRQAKAAFEGKSVKSVASREQTDFTELTGSAQIADGVAENKDLAAKTPLMRIAGTGKANLREDTVDYKLKGTVVASVKGQGGEDLRDLAGLTIPIRIEGPFEKPEVGVDMDDLLKDLVAKRAKEKLEKVRKEARRKVEKQVEEKLEEQLGDKLKGLFGR